MSVKETEGSLPEELLKQQELRITTAEANIVGDIVFSFLEQQTQLEVSGILNEKELGRLNIARSAFNKIWEQTGKRPLSTGLALQAGLINNIPLEHLEKLAQHTETTDPIIRARRYFLEKKQGHEPINF